MSLKSMNLFLMVGDYGGGHLLVWHFYKVREVALVFFLVLGLVLLGFIEVDVLWGWPNDSRFLYGMRNIFMENLLFRGWIGKNIG